MRLLLAVMMLAGTWAHALDGGSFALRDSTLFNAPELDLAEGYVPTAAGAACPPRAGAGWSCSFSTRTFATGEAIDAGARSALYLQNAASNPFGARSAKASNGTSIVVPAPAGLAPGDLVLVAVGLNGSTVVTPPAGFTSIRNTGLAFVQLSTFWKLASGAEPVSYTFSWAGNTPVAAAAIGFAGVDAVAPISDVVDGTAAITTSHLAPSATTSAINSRFVVVHVVSANVTLTLEPDLSPEVDIATAGAVGLAVRTGVQWVPGATGPHTATASMNGDSANQTLVLRPSSTEQQCPLTIKLQHNALQLASAGVTVGSATPSPLFNSALASPAVAFASGDRLHLVVTADADAGNCGARLLFDGALTPSLLQLAEGVGALDAGSVDAGSVDAGSVDAGSVDAGSVDAGSVDAGSVDAGSVDAGLIDAGFDAGTADGGEPPQSDAGVHDGGSAREPAAFAVGCSCDSGSVLAVLALLLLRRRRAVRASR